jgi:hypothetical protein
MTEMKLPASLRREDYSAVAGAVSRRIRDKGGSNEAQQLLEYQAWSNTKNKDASAAIYAYFHKDTLNRFLRGPQRQFRQPRVPESIIAFYYESYRDVFDVIIDERARPHSDIINYEKLCTTLQPTSFEAVERLRRLCGTYQLYRRFGYDEAQVMVCGLVIVENDKVFTFLLSAAYSDERGHRVDEMHCGVVSTSGDNTILIGSPTAAFIPTFVLLTELHIDAGTGTILQGEGVMMLGANARLPSAYPIAIERAETLAPLRVLTHAMFVDAVASHGWIGKVLERGTVRWREGSWNLPQVGFEDL